MTAASDLQYGRDPDRLLRFAGRVNTSTNFNLNTQDGSVGSLLSSLPLENIKPVCRWTRCRLGALHA